MTIAFLDIAKWVGGSLTALAAITALIGVAYAQFRKGSRDESNAVVTSADNISEFWHKQADEYKAMMAVKEESFQKQFSDSTERYQKQISELTEKVGVLTGKLANSTEYADKLEKIFQGRNPEMEAFMKFMVQSSNEQGELMRQAVKDATESHTQIITVLKDIHDMSASNHQILDARKDSGKKEVIIEGTLEKKQ